MSDKIKTDTQNHQVELAQHLEALHLDINKLCMENWAILAKGAFDPEKIQKIHDALNSISQRLTYAQNCCWWIEQNAEQERLLKGIQIPADNAETRSDPFEGLPGYVNPTDNAIN